MDQEHIPDFTDEGEEADWWDAHPEVLTGRFRAAQKNGTVRRLSQTDMPGASETSSIRIPNAESVRAREFAAKRGLRYEAYLRKLLHEALDSEEKRLAG